MLARLEKDALAHKPDWVVVGVGVHDVLGQFEHSAGNQSNSIPIYEFGYNYAEIVRRIISNGARPLLLETTFLAGTLDDGTLAGPANQLLGRYNDVISENSDRFGAPVIPIHQVLTQAEQARRSRNSALSYMADDYHLNQSGVMLYALTVYDFFANA
jgi:lysophospholipase L1-like esterase